MREAYIVDKNSIRNINRIYVGVAGKARKVVKGYVGVNGKARLMFERDKEITKLTPVNLSYTAYNQSGCSSDNYALIGGGNTGSGTASTVNAFNSSLSRSLPSALGESKMRMGSTSWKNQNNNGMIFAGGEIYNSGWSKSNLVEKYDYSLTKSYLSNLSAKRSQVSCISLNPSSDQSWIAIAGGIEDTQGGGYDAVSTVEMYSSQGTKTSWPSLSHANNGIGAAVIPSQPGISTSYIAFGGGSGSWARDINLYSGGVKVDHDGFPVDMVNCAASTLGYYGIFGGASGYVYRMNIYGTLTAASNNLSITSYSRTAIPLENVVLFAGGGTAVEGYDENLVKNVYDSFSNNRGAGIYDPIASAKVDNTVLFAGGNYVSYELTNGDTADVYKVDYA